MTFTFRPAVKDQTNCLIALAGASGSGKTYSALRLARGLVGTSGKIAMLDTEARRGLHYADMFQFDHCDMSPPFTPERLTEAVEAAASAGYQAILIDSASDEYEGIGGLQDIQHETLIAMATDKQTGKFNSRRAEALTAPSWKDAKMRHKRMMAHLRQLRAHVIFCLRAEEKVRFEKVKNEHGYETTKIIPVGFQPICEKSFMYDMTVSFLLVPDAPGLPKPIKLQEQHKACFPDAALIDEASGQRLAAWAKGGAEKQPSPPPKLEPYPPPPAPRAGPEKPADAAKRLHAEMLAITDIIALDNFKERAEPVIHEQGWPKAWERKFDEAYRARREALKQ